MDEAQRRLTDAMVGYLIRLILMAHQRGMRPPYTFLFSSPNGTTLDGVVSENSVPEFFDDDDRIFDLPVTLRLTDDRGEVIERIIHRVH